MTLKAWKGSAWPGRVFNYFLHLGNASSFELFEQQLGEGRF